MEANQDLIFAQWEPHFVLETQKQLVKDFGQHSLDLPSSFLTEAQSKAYIESAIRDALALCVKQGESRLMALLYTIDVPQTIFVSLNTARYLEDLAEIILKREALKVYWRIKMK
jgi:hypothetical protein